MALYAASFTCRLRLYAVGPLRGLIGSSIVGTLIISMWANKSYIIHSIQNSYMYGPVLYNFLIIQVKPLLVAAHQGSVAERSKALV